MANSIDARIEFSYRGEIHHPSASIDLDKTMEAGGIGHGLHLQLAKASGIDSYSYLYEVMESYPITFSNPKGIAADYLSGAEFDFAGFETHWRETRDFTTLDVIIAHHFNDDECARHPALRVALREAFRVGKAAGK